MSNIDNNKILPEKTSDYFSNSREEMLKYLPVNAKKILDVGCGDANFGTLAKEKNHAEVWGIELDKEAAKKAELRIDKVLTGNVSDLIKFLPDSYFDCIFFNDVLEHLYNPYDLLLEIKSKLSPQGIIVCSIPNIRHISILKELLIDKQWKYREYGILDFTHLRFFTKKSVIEMFKSLDYELLKLDGLNPTSSFRRFTIFNIIFLGQLSDSKYNQYACVAKPKNNGKN